MSFYFSTGDFLTLQQGILFSLPVTLFLTTGDFPESLPERSGSLLRGVGQVPSGKLTKFPQESRSSPRRKVSQVSEGKILSHR